MRRRDKGLVEILLMAPWWVSAALALLVYCGSRFLLPEMLASKGPIGEGLASGLPPMAVFLALPFVAVAVGSAFFGAKRRRLVDQQSNLNSLRAVSWKDFEFMVGEAFRREGYRVEETLGVGADGGVDLVLSRNGAKFLVQCKQWRKQAVGVQVIREQFGILTAEGAAEIIIVTSGSFTQDARDFARGKPMRLIDGPELLKLVRSVQQAAPANAATAELATEIAAQDKIPACPQCGQLMLLRTSQRGATSGNQFWGCSRFPQCRGTRPA